MSAEHPERGAALLARAWQATPRGRTAIAVLVAAFAMIACGLVLTFPPVFHNPVSSPGEGARRAG